jgi:hypothetical protein
MKLQGERLNLPTLFKECVVYRRMTEGTRGKGTSDIDMRGRKAKTRLSFESRVLDWKMEGSSPLIVPHSIW